MTAKLTIENDLTTRMTERQPVTSVLQDSGQKSSIETFVLYLKFWLRFKVSNIDPLPRKAVSRCTIYYDNGTQNKRPFYNDGKNFSSTLKFVLKYCVSKNINNFNSS